MAEWTPEAREYLDGYLKQVTALARSQGDDAEDIADDLRVHVEREAEDAPGALVTVDYLRGVLAKTGAPEQIAGIQDGLDGWDGDVSSRPETVGSSTLRSPVRKNGSDEQEAPLSTPGGPSPVPNSPPQPAPRSRVGCWIVGVIVAFLVSAAAVFTVLVLMLFVRGHRVAPESAQVEALPQSPPAVAVISGNEAAVSDIMQKIKSAQKKFQEEKRLDIDGDGVGDYGTLDQLTTPGDGGEPLLDEEFPSGVSHDYRFIIEVCPSALDGSPHYQCVALDTKPGPKKNQCFHLDERGIVSTLGSWEPNMSEQDIQRLEYQPN